MSNENQPSTEQEDAIDSSIDALAKESDPGIVREFIWFLRYNKKWWMTPIILIMLLLVGLAFLTTSPIGPFIYTLF